jgi:hypothetical protein
MLGAVAWAVAESWGFIARQANHARDTNPYAAHQPQSSTALELAEAWWSGWDRGDALLAPD